MKTVENIEKLNDWYNYLVDVCCISDEIMGSDELLEVIDDNELIELLTDLDQFDDYNNTYEYEEGLKRVWTSYVDKYEY